MNIETKYNLGDMVIVKKKYRSPDLPGDANNIGEVTAIETLHKSIGKKIIKEIQYIVQFDKSEPDWDETYTEDQLDAHKGKKS
jgi:hypothetical protein